MKDKSKQIRLLQEQRRRDRRRLLLIKKHQDKQNKILEQIKEINYFKNTEAQMRVIEKAINKPKQK